MFNSLATFLFGAQATSEPSDNCEANPVQQNPNDSALNERDVIEVTSSTPSVAGNNRGGTVRTNGNGSGKRGGGGAKQRRARQRQQQQQQQSGQRKQAPSITKLLTPSGERNVLEEDFNEDEWYIVEEEGE